MQNRCKKILIIYVFTVIAFFSNTGFAFAQASIPEQLTKIENEVWGFSYEGESDAERLQRIEKQVFGTANLKLTPQKRVDKITKTLGLETLEEAKSSLSDLYVPEKEGQNVQYPQIDSLESQLLGNVYKNENIYVRLERLEKKVFGAKQDGDLSVRTDNLKNHAGVNIGQNPAQNAPYYSGADRTSYYGSENNFGGESYDAEIKFQLSALENAIFSTDFSQEPVNLRLTRLENKIFQRDFNGDEVQTRISRIQAAATAGKTAKYYDNNKFQKFASTGLQAASFILMILAFIL